MSKKLATLQDFQQYCNEWDNCSDCPFYAKDGIKNKCGAFMSDIDELNDFILTHKKMRQKENKSGND